MSYSRVVVLFLLIIPPASLAAQDKKPEETNVTPPFRHTRPLKRLALSPDGKSLVTTTDHGGLLWDVATGKIVHRLDHMHMDWRDPGPTFTPNGKFIIANGVWDVSTGKPQLNVPGLVKTFVDDGRMLTIFGEAYANTRLFSLKAGKVVRQFEGYFIGLSRDARTVTTRIARPAQQHRIVVWDLATGKQLHQLPMPILECQYEGRLVLTQGMNEVNLMTSSPARTGDSNGTALR